MNLHITPSLLFRDLAAVKEISPLIHNITNLVVMQTTANVLLAIGASPIMAHATEELEEIVSLSNALLINMGTLDKSWGNSAEKAQAIALKRGIPIVFDPVGSGASRYRTDIAKSILKNGVTIVRGNASEIVSLVNDCSRTRGVDSQLSTDMALNEALTLSEHYQCCVVVSGKTDLVCYQKTIIKLHHGIPLLTKVTGMGCSATAMIAAFSVINSNPALASIHAMTTLAIAAEKAEKLARGPGTFYVCLLDALYQLEESDFYELNIEVN